jgi:hypothetical protein
VIPRFAADSVPKKLFKPLRRQGGIARRVLNVAMPEISLDRTRVVTVIGELKAAGVAEHVGVGLDAETCSGGYLSGREHIL